MTDIFDDALAITEESVREQVAALHRITMPELIRLLKCGGADSENQKVAGEEIERLRNFTPTSDQINALPDGIRSFIHDLETRCDPAGETQARILAEDAARGLMARVEELENENESICAKITFLREGSRHTTWSGHASPARSEPTMDDSTTDYCATETPHVDCAPPECDHGTLSRDHTPSSTRCPHCNGDLTAPEDMDVEPVYASHHFYYNDPDSMRRYREHNQAEDVKLALWNFINDSEDGIHNIVKWKRDPAFWEGLTGYSVLAWVEERLAEVFEAHGVDWEG
jgi:hypothetical protein